MFFLTYEHTEGLYGKCLQQVIVRRPKLKFWPNLMLAVATVGIWGIFWYKNAKRLDKQWRCTRCGSEVFRLIEYRF